MIQFYLACVDEEECQPIQTAVGGRAKEKWRKRVVMRIRSLENLGENSVGGIRVLERLLF
jgi:hypothetical protein